MKIGFIGDLHIGLQENNDNFIDYQTKTLRWIYDKFFELDITDLIYLGDIFDKRRYIVFKTFYLLNEIFGDSRFKHHILAGNHDCYYKDSNKINSLDLVFRNKFNLVTQLPQDVLIGDEQFLFVPWVNKKSVVQASNLIKASNSKYMFAHLDLSGFELIRGIISKEDSINKKLLEPFNRVISGHYHCYSEKSNITFLGSPLEQTWNDVNDQKFIGVLDTEKDDLSLIKCPYTLYEKIKIKSDQDTEINIDLLKDKNIKIYLFTKRNVKIEKFIESLVQICNSVNVIDEQIMSCTLDLDIETEDMTIVKLWSAYLEELDIPNKDKKSVSKIFENTYLEATSGDELGI